MGKQFIPTLFSGPLNLLLACLDQGDKDSKIVLSNARQCPAGHRNCIR